MENNRQMIAPADLVVNKVKDVYKDLWILAETDSFVGSFPRELLKEYILSFVYQYKHLRDADDKRAAKKNTQIPPCTLGSIREAFKASLDIGIPVSEAKLAYLTRYGNELSYHIGYRGYIHKIRQLHPNAYVEVHLLFDGDEFEYQSGGGIASYHYKPAKSIRGDFENVTGGFAYISYFQNGREYSYVTPVDKSEIENAYNASKMREGATWKLWMGEMKKKIVIRRACKLDFIGEAPMEKILRYDNKNFVDIIARPTVNAKPVDYAEAMPLDLSNATPKAISAEIIDAPADNGAADE